MAVFREHPLAHQLLDQLHGLEIGAAAHNPFGLNTRNVAPLDNHEFYASSQSVLGSKPSPVHIWATADAIPVPGDSEDFVLSSHVVEHLPNVITTFVEWNRVVRPGGVVFMIVPLRDAHHADIRRPLTTLEHLIDDYRQGYTLDTHPIADVPGGRMGHYHVLTPEILLAVVDWMNEKSLTDWDLVAREDIDSKVGNGFTLAFRVRSKPEEPSNPESTATTRAVAERQRPECELRAPLSEMSELRQGLAIERTLSRSLARVVQRLKDRLAEIECTRLWQWRCRWKRLRAKLRGTSSRRGINPWYRVLGLLTRDGRRTVRKAVKLTAKKIYLWLEEEPVEIVLRRAGQIHGSSGDPYERWLAERAPRSTELDDYREHLADLKVRPKISVLMPVFDPPLEFFRAAVQSVLDQVYPDWELCIADDASTNPEVRKRIAEFARAEPRIAVVYRMKNGHISAASNSALALATGEFCALLDHDDLLTPDALYHMAVALNRRPDLDLLYSDEDKVDEAGRLSDPHFKPQWCPDTLLGGNYVCHLLTARTDLLHAIGGFREGLEGAQDFDLVLRLGERTSRIHHVPRVLYHWRQHENSTARAMDAKPYAYQAGVRAIEQALVRRKEPGTVSAQPEAAGYYSVRYVLDKPGRVGIVIPTRDRSDLLEVCVRTVFENTAYRDFEILVVDNGSREPRTFDLFRKFAASHPGRFGVHRDEGTFNFSRLVNVGVRIVGGPYVLLLNNDIEVIERTWLGAMLEQAQRPSVGCVGARLLYPDGTVQHSGVVVGRGGLALHAFQHAERDAIGYANRLHTVANYSAVTGACLLVRREVYDGVGGFDERFAVDFNDVDFCLRVRQAGLQNLLVPHAELIHHESVSRGHPRATSESSLRHEQEIALFRERWPDYLACDPCVSPHLVARNGDLRIVA